MTRAMLLAIALLIPTYSLAGSVTGTIGVRLVIYSRCEIRSPEAPSVPQIDCGRQASAQPRVTRSVIQSQAQGSRKQNNQLVTVEW